MKQLDSHSRIIALGGALLAIIFGVVTFQMSNEPIDTQQQQLSMAQQSLDEDTAVIHQIPQLEEKQAELREQIGHISIGKGTIPDMLQYLGSVGSRHSVVINDMTFTAPSAPTMPQAPGVDQAPALSQSSGVQAQAQLADQRTPAAVAAGAPPASQFSSQTVKFTMTGAYRDLLYALADLSHGPSLIRVDSQPSLQTADGGTVKMSVTATLLEVGDAFAALAARNEPVQHRARPRATAAKAPSHRVKSAPKSVAVGNSYRPVPSGPIRPIGHHQQRLKAGLSHG